MKKSIVTLAAATGGLFIAGLLIQAMPANENTTPGTFESAVKTFPVPLPDKMDFAGEAVPLSMYDVRERLDREMNVNTYWQSQTILYLKRAARWFPVIEPILKKNNIPSDFKYVAVAESGLINSISNMQAVGFWQFMEGTAKKSGLTVTEEIDERYSVEASTEAACRFLNEARAQFGSWTMAAAAYNMGMAGLQSQVDRQHESNFYDLLLNDETFRYLFRILAVKQVMKHPEKYGFRLESKDLYAPLKYTSVTVDSSVIDLALWSQKMNTNYKNLKLLNPWLRQSTLTNPQGRKYTIKILAKGYTGIAAE